MHRLRQALASTTVRLAGSYLLIIMLMSISFSIVFYKTSSHELGRQVPPPSVFGVRRFEDFNSQGPGIDSFFEERIAQGRRALLTKLITLNVFTLGAGSVVSYYLARRTLRPIEANLEAQSQFVSDASHELRTPLTALQTSNEVALRKPKLTNSEARQLLTYNVQEVEKLKQLTSALLGLARQDANDTRLGKTRLQDIVADALNVIVTSAVAKDVAIEDTVADIAVMANRLSLVQALVTILDNAIKYSPPHTTVYVSAASENNQAMLRVRDDGPGIAAKDLPHIFDRFYRADQSRGKQQVDGYGIGLALAKKIISQHSGRITVDSQLGAGSTFIITLPLA